MEDSQYPFQRFTPDEAAHLQLQELSNPNASGLGVLEVPAAFTSRDIQYRIRLTMLNAMGSNAPGSGLDLEKRNFLTDFRGVLSPLVFSLFSAEWDYLASLREALYEGFGRTFRAEPSRVLIETLGLLRVFANSYHNKQERVDFGLLRAYVTGFTDSNTTSWLRTIWTEMDMDKKQTFFKRLSTVRNLKKLPRQPT